jgi:hypothetical protein
MRECSKFDEPLLRREDGMSALLLPCGDSNRHKLPSDEPSRIILYSRASKLKPFSGNGEIPALALCDELYTDL